MYLSATTANILQKFNSQPINILYEPQRNLFDVSLASCGLNLFIDQRYNPLGIQDSTVRLLNDVYFDLYNYNVGISNNIVGYSTQKRFSSLHLNTLIFTHSDRPQQIKKEDAVLLDQNLRREYKIFFSQSIANSWRFNNNVQVYNYGINKEFYDEKNERNNRVLLLNMEKSPHVESLAQFLHTHGIETDIVADIHFDIDILRTLFNKYSVCVEFNEYNIINLLTAIACGCKCITYATPMIVENYQNTPNLYFAKTVQDLISSIKEVKNTPIREYQKYIETEYSFDNFKTRIVNTIEKANNEAFII